MKSSKNKWFNPVAPTELDWSDKHKLELMFDSETEEWISTKGRVKLFYLVDENTQTRRRGIAIRNQRFRVCSLESDGRLEETRFVLHKDQKYLIVPTIKTQRSEIQAYVLIRLGETPEHVGQYVIKKGGMNVISAIRGELYPSAQILLVSDYKASETSSGSSESNWYYATDAEGKQSTLTAIDGIVHAFLQPIGVEKSPTLVIGKFRDRERPLFMDDRGRFISKKEFEKTRIKPEVDKPTEPEEPFQPNETPDPDLRDNITPTPKPESKRPQAARASTKILSGTPSPSPSRTNEQMDTRSKRKTDPHGGPTQARLSQDEEPPKDGADYVESIVFAPPTSAPKESFYVQVHVTVADNNIKISVSGDNMLGYHTLVTRVDRGAVIAFDLLMPGFHIDNPTQKITWNGKHQSVKFAVTVPNDQPETTVRAKVRVNQNDAPVGEIGFSIRINKKAERAKSAPTGDTSKRYSMAFTSYAKEDRDVVIVGVQALQAAGVKVFLDVLDLDPGERWEKGLYKHIDECDLFELYWSSYAKASKWVRKEANYALQRQCGERDAPPDIKPIILKGLPLVLPWPELAHLHFNHPGVGFLTRQDSSSNQQKDTKQEPTIKVGLDCLGTTKGKNKHGLSTQALVNQLIPYVEAIAELQRIIVELNGRFETPSIFVKEVFATPPIWLNIQGVEQAASLVRYMIVPWFRDREAQIMELNEEIEKIKKGEQSKSDDEEDLETLQKRLENETTNQTLEESRVNLAVRILDTICPDLSNAQKIVYASQLLKPLHVLTEGLLMAELKEK